MEAEQFLKENYNQLYHLLKQDETGFDFMEDYANQSKWISVEDLLSNFKDGQKRYNTDPRFHAYIQCILRGDNVYKLLDELILNNETTIGLK